MYKRQKLPAFTGSKRELMELFNEFAEDYNTATMPDDKYYDLERWELEEYERRKRGERKAGGEMTAFDDEAQVEAARRREREARDRANEEADARSAAARMGEGKRQELKDLEILRQKQQQAYKRGDLDSVLEALANDRAERLRTNNHWAATVSSTYLSPRYRGDVGATVAETMRVNEAVRAALAGPEGVSAVGATLTRALPASLDRRAETDGREERKRREKTFAGPTSRRVWPTRSRDRERPRG